MPLKRPTVQKTRSRGESDGIIHLWYASLRHSGWRWLAELLSDGERRRADAFIFARDARRFIVSHAVLRTLLSRVTGIPTRELEFPAKPGLKPVLQVDTVRLIHFSLSRSEEMALIGVAPRALGVDIEWLGKSLDIEALGKDVLSRSEQKVLNQLHSADRQEAFLRCWTQKEAYLKAIGTGLCVPPAAVEIRFRVGGPAGLKSVFGDEHAAAGWCVEVVMPGDDYIAAVAIPGTQWRVIVTAFDTSSLLLGS